MAVKSFNNYLGVWRLWAETFVPPLRVCPLTLTVIGPLRAGFSEHFPLRAITQHLLKGEAVG